MKVKFIYKIFPVFIFYSDFLLLKEYVSGRASCCFIQIRKKYKEDRGLLEHELTHIKQSYKGLFIIHSLLYLLSKNYRFNSEVEAYVKQIYCYHISLHSKKINLFANFIVDRYGLDVTIKEALEKLRGEYLNENIKIKYKPFKVNLD